MLALALATSCAPDYTQCTALASTDASCETYPALCAAHVESVIHTSDWAHAYDLVFVPDGYTADELPMFRAKVDALIDGLEHDDGGIVELAPTYFNYHRVDIASASSDVYDADRTNTALGGCLANDSLGGSEPFLSANDALAQLAARANAPDADVVIVVANATWGRPDASPGLVHFSSEYSAAILTHELGHALFGLADEYSDADGCYAPEPPLARFATRPIDLPSYANVSTDRAGTKWASLVHGAEPGGRRQSDCIYHPTDSCRMLSQDGDFCPVCRHEILRAIAAHTRDVNDGPPEIAMGTDQPLDTAQRVFDFVAVCIDRNLPIQTSIELDHVVLFQSTSNERTTWSTTSLQLDPGRHDIGLECRDAQGQMSHDQLSVTVP